MGREVGDGDGAAAGVPDGANVGRRVGAVVSSTLQHSVEDASLVHVAAFA